MPKTKAKKNNLRLAGIFIAAVLGLIVLSFAVKLIFVIKDSKFDGIHKFNILLIGTNEKDVISFSPQSRSITILKVDNSLNDLSNILDVPIDGTVNLKGNLNVNNLSTQLIKLDFPLGQKISKLTFFDLLKLALFSRTVPSDSIYQREYSNDFSNAQKNTIISLTFTDPTIYEENLSIEIVNATSVNGLGAKIAEFISNIGGNPVLVTNNDDQNQTSKLIYYGQKTYTIDKLSSYFNLQTQKTDQRGIADVIIIIGKDFKNGDK